MLRNQIILLAIGFLLTTAVGGLLGTFFQRRTWDHQHRVTFEEQERERAVKVFEEISRLLDKRLYRMRLAYWALEREQGGNPSEFAKEQWQRYRDVLLEWNDGINRNLALLQQYFGTDVRDRFDYIIGDEIVKIGAELLSLWRGEFSLSEIRPVGRLEHQLQHVAGLIYQFNLTMVRALQSGKVGWLVPEHRQLRDE